MLTMTQSAAADMNARLECGADASTLILLRQCRDLRRQEVCLRVATLLLLLTCTTLFVLTNTEELKQDQARSRNKREAVCKQVEENLERFTDDAQNQVESSPRLSQKNDAQNQDVSHMRVHLRLKIHNDPQQIEWDPTIGPNYYHKEKNVIILPQSGLYFVYVRIALECSKKSTLHMTLYHWSKKYDDNVILTRASDTCFKRDKNVFVGQLFDLEEGEVGVTVHEGHEYMSQMSAFGAFAL